jgi:NTP pyrophosphatase (non-canonical NTP hydrolase)
MNNQSYQNWAMTKDRTGAQYDELGARLDESISQLRLLHGAMGISGEAGELMDAIKKHILYNKPLDVTNVKEELGDLCWYMALMLDQVGSSFDEVMKMNHDKLEKRFPGGFTEKLAQQRLDKVETGETPK